MLTCKNAKERSILSADISFDKSFKFNLNELPESNYINDVIKHRLEISFKEEKTIHEHFNYINTWVEETLKLQNKDISLDDLGMNHHNFRKQMVEIFQTVSVASIQ